MENHQSLDQIEVSPDLPESILPTGPDTLARFLRDSRISQGKTLNDVADETNISLSNLQALETGDRTILPAKVFVRGFIRIYTSYLGIDQQRAYDLLDLDWGAGYDSVSDTHKPISAEAMAKPAPILNGLTTLVIIVLVLAGSFFILQVFFPELLNKHPEKDQLILDQTKSAARQQQAATDQDTDSLSRLPLSPPTPLKKKQPTTQKKSAKDTSRENLSEKETIVEELAQSEVIPPANRQESPHSGEEKYTHEPTTDPSLKNHASPEEENDDSTPNISTADGEKVGEFVPVTSQVQYELTANFSSRTWIKIIIDGEPAYENIFSSGDSRTWQANETIDLILGNSGGVDLTLNGKEMEYKKEIGHTIRLTIP